MRKVFLIDKDSFTKTWYCEVASSLYHNGSTCDWNAPHGEWDCGWRYVLHISYDEKSFKKEFDSD